MTQHKEKGCENCGNIENGSMVTVTKDQKCTECGRDISRDLYRSFPDPHEIGQSIKQAMNRENDRKAPSFDKLMNMPADKAKAAFEGAQDWEEGLAEIVRGSATDNPYTLAKIEDFIRQTLAKQREELATERFIDKTSDDFDAGRAAIKAELMEKFSKVPYGTNGSGEKWYMKEDIDVLFATPEDK